MTMPHTYTNNIIELYTINATIVLQFSIISLVNNGFQAF